MPVILFTVGEVAQSAVEACREASAEIVRLSDLEKCPLAPGESPDVRRHKIAKLGKQLAEAFTAFDEIMAAHAKQHAAAHGHVPSSEGSPSDDDDKKAN